MPAKSDGTVRITTDLSRLNKYVVPTRFDVPMPSKIFQMVHGSSFLSMLDLMKAFHHVPLAPESRPLTLTMMPLGPRQYMKLPLGLKQPFSVQSMTPLKIVLGPVSQLNIILLMTTYVEVATYSAHL